MGKHTDILCRNFARAKAYVRSRSGRDNQGGQEVKEKRCGNGDRVGVPVRMGQAGDFHGGAGKGHVGIEGVD